MDTDSHIKKKYNITQPAVVDLKDFIGKRDVEADDFKLLKMINDRYLLWKFWNPRGVTNGIMNTYNTIVKKLRILKHQFLEFMSACL